MNRREAIGLLLTTTVVPLTRSAADAGPKASGITASSALERKIGTRLIHVTSPLAASAARGGADARSVLARCRNPYLIGDEPGLTQTFGWVGAWATQPSDRAVVAAGPSDVAAAIDFARTTGVRLVVKGGGHSYLGNSNAAGSLLVWTRKLRTIEMSDAFRGEGWPADRAGVPAVSVGAGCIWGEVYRAAAARGRAVLGGGCLTVGVAGFVLGGGFGSLSKTFGTGASNLLEAEIVTADGRVRVVNEHREPELFFALRGGGGGTFGVVTRLTLRTHPMPRLVGAVQFKAMAITDAGFAELVRRTMTLYADALHNPSWGEQIRFSPGRRMSVSMVSSGLDRATMERAWAPLLRWIAERPEEYRLDAEPVLLEIPGASLWDPAFLKTVPGLVKADDRPGASPDNVYWTENAEEAGQVLYAYRSAWLPEVLLEPGRRAALADALVEAAAEWPVALHFNKGMAGGSPAAVEAVRATAMNAEAAGAFALLICAANGPPGWPGLPGHEPDRAVAARQARAVDAAMGHVLRVAPGAGSYMSESDFHHPDWKRAYWGANYPRLAAAKRRYDPDGMFTGRNCVERA